MEIIQTGQSFVARDALGREYVYRLLGIDPGPESAGHYIVLRNLTLKEETRVEHNWLLQRDIRPPTVLELAAADKGWPKKIHTRGCDAYLVDLQPLTGGEAAAIYRFPGGDSVVFDDEIRASLPAEVVLPDPCRPTSMMTAGSRP